MMKLTIIALLASCLMICPSVSGGEIRLCGRMLADALSMLCQGVYNGPSDARRDVNHRMAAIFPRWILTMGSQRLGETLPRPAYLGNRYQRGVVDECCTNSCTADVLMSYCG